MWESLRTVRVYLWRYRGGLALGLGALVLKDVADVGIAAHGPGLLVALPWGPGAGLGRAGVEGCRGRRAAASDPGGDRCAGARVRPRPIAALRRLPGRTGRRQGPVPILDARDHHRDLARHRIRPA